MGVVGSGLRDSWTPQLARPGWTQAEAKINAHQQTEGGLWAAQTHTRTSPHNGLLSMPGQGHGRGPQQGHHGCPASWEAMEKPACSQLLPWPPEWAFHTMSRGRERPGSGTRVVRTHTNGHRDKPRMHRAVGAILVGTHTHACATHAHGDGSTCMVRRSDTLPRGVVGHPADMMSCPGTHHTVAPWYKDHIGHPTRTVTHTSATQTHRDGVWGDPQTGSTQGQTPGGTRTLGKGPAQTHTIHEKMAALRPKTLMNTLKSGRTQAATHSQPPGPSPPGPDLSGRKGKTPLPPTQLKPCCRHRVTRKHRQPGLLLSCLAGGKGKTPDSSCFKSRGWGQSR